MKHNRATIYSVAEVAGVSRQTVSNVLNHPERVSPDLQKSVQEAIRDTGYRPSASARALALARAGLVAFRVGDGKHNEVSILDPFMREVARIGSTYGYRLVLDYVPDNDKSQIASYEGLAAGHTVDAVIIAETHPDDQRPQWLIDHAIPFVAFGRPWGNMDARHSWVDVDVGTGVRLAVNHLAARGHQRIAYAGSSPDNGRRQERWSGWYDAMAGLFGPGETTRPSQWESLALRCDLTRLDAALGKFLAEQKPTAIVCQDDEFGHAVMLEAVRQGLIPGRDVAVVGFDDSVLARTARPTMSSVAQPLTKVVELVWQSLIDQIERPGTPPIHALVCPTLITRESSDFQLTHQIWGQPSSSSDRENKEKQQ
ncbi:MAG: substrate-binding domain-containing protein [Bifidobacteriaceae bacterium]|jgi:DNA-binding LacI/PurR family transcriptional regulator|nr:substrate-binding domain-containing protein [Bifidobacteriaceae bacterium]